MSHVDRIIDHSFFTDSLGPEATVVDLGLNHGDFAMEIIARYGCSVIGVEPEPELFANLPKHPRLVAEQAAIAGEEGEVQLHLNMHSNATLADGLAEASAEMVSVRATTLDALLARHDVERVSLLKVDIEGAEIALFRTASDAALRQVDQMTIEFHDFLDPGLTAGVLEVHERLTALGFQRLGFSLDNTDVVYVNRLTLPLTRLDTMFALARYKYPRGALRRIRRSANHLRQRKDRR